LNNPVLSKFGDSIMSSKNEAPALVIAFLATAGLIGGGLWWLSQRTGGSLTEVVMGRPGCITGSADEVAPVGLQRIMDVQNVPSGLFNYGGSTTWAPLRSPNQVDAAIQAAHPPFRLRYVQQVGKNPGSGTGVQMLLQGDLTFAQISRPLTSAVCDQAKQRQMQFKQVAVAVDGLAIAVNPNLPITGLTVNQLAGIYTGRITNWQAIGGPNLPIVPLTRSSTAGGTVEFFVERVLQKQPTDRAPFPASVKTIATTTEALRQLANTPGAIYYASAPEVVPQCKVKPIALGLSANDLISPYDGALISPDQCPAQRNRLNVKAFQTGQYPLTRNLYVVIHQNRQTEQKAGETYASFLLSGEGQELIEKAGYVRVR
jgi:phosphate transport system substrate-binding protein